MTVIVIVAVVVAYLAFHGGHAHSNYRHGRARGKRVISFMLLYLSDASAS